MPQYPNRQFIDFEQPIKDLYEQIEQTKKLAEKNQKIDYSSTVIQLEESIVHKRREITENLTPWQRVQLSRHPDRPYMLKYIEKLTTNFIECHGDRSFADDKAMIGGFADLDGETVMLIGQQKGHTTKMRQLRNFGMAKPEGYRKALRLMKLAEKFDKPIITFIDTPGAYPGLEGEERGQGEASAREAAERREGRLGARAQRAQVEGELDGRNGCGAERETRGGACAVGGAHIGAAEGARGLHTSSGGQHALRVAQRLWHSRVRQKK